MPVAGINVTVDQVGIANHLRPGSWTPIRLVLDNPSLQNRRLRLTAAINDEDGDEMHLIRESVSLAAGQTGLELWLIARPPVSAAMDRPFARVRVSDADTGEVLGLIPILARQVISPFDRAIAVSGSRPFGLQAFSSTNTRHEAARLLEGLDLRRLPDRWFGLSMLEMIVWSPAGTDPQAMTTASAQAMLEWVHRGGHLVISTGSTVDRLWEGLSQRPAFRPLIEGFQLRENPDRYPAPDWLGQTSTELSIGMVAVHADPRLAAAPLLFAMIDQQPQPIVASRSIGLGRVTVIGINLDEPVLAQAGLPLPQTFWNRLLSWHNPVIPDREFEEAVARGEFFGPEDRRTIERGRFIPDQISMTGRIGGTIVLAVFLFLAYALIAGPFSFRALRARGKVYLAWPVFLLTALAFSAILWGWALIQKEHQTQVAHLSVVTLDGTSGGIFVQSWLAIRVPEHQPANIALPPDGELRDNLLSPGAETRPDRPITPFVDSRTYPFDLHRPDTVDLPFRATARPFHVDFRTDQNADNPVARQYGGWNSLARWDGRRLHGSVTHRLPVALHDVVVILTPPATPTNPNPEALVWPLYDIAWSWQPGEPLDLAQISQNAPAPLVGQMVRPDGDALVWEQPRRPRSILDQPLGFTAMLASDTGEDRNLTQAGITKRLELLSLFSALPPPDIRRSRERLGHTTDRTVGFARTTPRSMDLTQHLALPRLVILAHARPQAPLPLPLTVNDQAIDQIDPQSRTVVRFLLPLDLPDSSQARTPE